MSKKADVWFPLYVGDYLSATTRLTTEQHGAYLLLIMDYWKSGAPPDDAAVLARITGLSPDAWSNAQAMLKSFFVVQDGCWIHKRVEREILNATEQKTSKHNKAKAAAAKRWEGHQTKDAPSNAPSNAHGTPQAMLKQCPSPSPSPYIKDLSSDDDISGKSEKAKASKVAIDYQMILDLYNQILPELASPKFITDKRKSAIRTCVATKAGYEKPEFWSWFFNTVREGSLLMGKSTPWKADFDWLTKHTNFIKVLEGNYK